MAVPPELLRLPNEFRFSGDPVDGNPFPEDDPRHKVWNAATRAAEEQILHFTSQYTPEIALSENENFLHRLTLTKFDAWARRGIPVVWSDGIMRNYDQWLVSYADSWLTEVHRFYERQPPPFSIEDSLRDLRAQLARRVQHWKAKARRYRTAQEEHAKQAASIAEVGEPVVSLALKNRRKELIKKYRRDQGLTAADLARRIGMSQSAILGIVNEDRTRFSEDTRNRFLQTLGFSLRDWYEG